MQGRQRGQACCYSSRHASALPGPGPVRQGHGCTEGNDRPRDTGGNHQPLADNGATTSSRRALSPTGQTRPCLAQTGGRQKLQGNYVLSASTGVVSQPQLHQCTAAPVPARRRHHHHRRPSPRPPEGGQRRQRRY